MAKKDNNPADKYKYKISDFSEDIKDIDSSDPMNNSNSVAGKRLQGIFDDMEKKLPNRSPEAMIGMGKGVVDLGLGIAGLFVDDNIGAPGYESTYETSKALPGMRDAAVQEAFGGGDDYAARIRAKNTQRAAVDSAVARSGGSRGFVQSNVAAADDVFNLQNLGIDKMMQDRKLTALNVAGNMENLVIQDKLNKMKDVQYSNEDKYRKLMAEIGLDRENRQGAMSRIGSGLNDIAGGLGHERQWGKNGTMKQIMLSGLLLEAQRKGIDLFGLKNQKHVEQYNPKPEITTSEEDLGLQGTPFEFN